jgi:hypothetical protein
LFKNVPGIFKIQYFGFFPVAKYLTREALEGFGDSKTGGKVIRNVRYADDLVLLAKEETVLQGMIERLVEIGRCYGMEVNVEEKKVMKISGQPFQVQFMICEKELENM